jgi:hypothetical protein
MDVFITEEHRGKGYSSIVDAMMKEAQLKKVKIWRLTADAHFLYEKFSLTFGNQNDGKISK